MIFPLLNLSPLKKNITCKYMTKLIEEITLQVLINKKGDSLMDRLKKDFDIKNKSKKKKKNSTKKKSTKKKL